MKVSVPKETAAGERRVALVPEVVARLEPRGIEVAIERGAGEAALLPDSVFEEAGAQDRVRGRGMGRRRGREGRRRPSQEEIGRLKRGAVYIGFLAPLTAPETVQALDSAGVKAFAIESCRGSRARSRWTRSRRRRRSPATARR